MTRTDRYRSSAAAAAQQRDHLDSQVPDSPIPLNDCSLVLPPLSEYKRGKDAKENAKAQAWAPSAARKLPR